MDEFYLNYYDTQFKQNNISWNKLNDFLVMRTFDAFTFIGSSFYFRMLNKVISNLIPTGIMSHLVENFYSKKIKFKRIGKDPKILNVDDLAFGFNIWLGFCAISVVAFVIELILGLKCCRKNLSFMVLKRKLINRKMKFEKVHPVSIFNSIFQSENREPSAELLAKFKIKKSAS